MIQVIDRVFKILECLGADKSVSLEDISALTSLNKGTLCNILKSLVVLGYVEKDGPGAYKLSSKMLRFTEPFSCEKTIIALCEKFVKRLADETKESGVLSTLREGKMQILAQSQYQRALMINPFSFYSNLSLYHSVSGRILAAYISPEQRTALLKTAGLPGAEWDNIKTVKDFETVSARVRETGIVVMLNLEKEIKSFAVPVFDKDGNICAALGLTVPVHRVDQKQEKCILESLRKNAEDFRKAIIKENLSQKDFIRNL